MTSPDRKIVTPTVGRKVWFRPNGIPTLQRANIDEPSFAIPKLISTQPLDATVVYVWDDRMVNLAVQDHYGNNFVAASVILVQEGDEKPSSGYYCEWMPYQTAQAKKEQAGIDRYAARAAGALTAIPTRQTHREALAVTLAEKIGGYIGESPDKAKTFADAVKAVLDVLAPDFEVSAGHSIPPLPFVLDGSQEKFGTVSIDSAIEQQIQAAGADKAPRVTPAALKDEIVSEHYFTAADGVVGSNEAVNLCNAVGVTEANGGRVMQELPHCLNFLTICVLVLRNGTKVVGLNYGAIDPAQHNAETGRQEARKQAEEKVWELLGFRLRDELARPVLTDADAAADLAGTPRP